MERILSALFSFLVATSVGAAERRVTGLVLEVDRSRSRVVVSCTETPGLVKATVVPFTVDDAAQLDGVSPGTMIEFALVDGRNGSRIADVRPRRFAGTDQQGLEAGQLALLDRITGAAPHAPLVPGSLVPDFTLIDQNRQPVTLSKLSGKLVVVSFMYTSCHAPEYCFRMSNNFGLLQKRFASRLGRDVVLLTISFDPVHDQPEVLARYGASWKADARGWHLLTGEVADVRRVCRMFGMNAWPDMGTITHDLHTILIDREGRLLADIEGNEFSARQLGDLVQSVLDR